MKNFRVTKMMHIMDFCDCMYHYVSRTNKPAVGQFNDVRIIMIHDDDFGKDEIINLNHMPTPIRYVNKEKDELMNKI